MDGGYLSKVLKALGEPRIDYRLLARWASTGFDLFRAYYYDCAAYQSARPSEDEKRRVSARQSFLNAINRHERFTVRLGRLAYRGRDERGSPIFEQKRVDLMLGLDVASLVSKTRIALVAIVAGDGDLLPIVKRAKDEGVIVRLIHGPKSTYEQDLWDEADERQEVTPEIVTACVLGAAPG
jgi:uncharacterized LabA/DUF88 family protein